MGSSEDNINVIGVQPKPEMPERSPRFTDDTKLTEMLSSSQNSPRSVGIPQAAKSEHQADQRTMTKKKPEDKKPKEETELVATSDETERKDEKSSKSPTS